jgi:hypothetical protein
MKASIVFVAVAVVALVAASCAPHRTCPTYTKQTTTVEKPS